MAMHINQISEKNSEYLVPNEEEKSKSSNNTVAFNFEPSEEDKNMGLGVEPENKPNKLVKKLVKPKKELMDKENEAYQDLNNTINSAFNKYLNAEHLGGIAKLLKNKPYKKMADKVKNYLKEQSAVVSESVNKPLPKVTKEFINKYLGNKEAK